ncbi:MAG TPA: copper resistance CopC family protein [Alloacidobacterium sp.]|nr:copper resistance CopC family protein [Alloacidobacterium sp.]
MKKIAMNSLVFVVAVVGMVCPAFAHAHLSSSNPQANSTVHGPAVAIDLKFDSRVDSARSHLDLVMPNGKIESLKITALSDAELGSHATLTPGKYAIRWQALSVDGHITRGEIPFTVQ